LIVVTGPCVEQSGPFDAEQICKRVLIDHDQGA
jgi:hypothetical protein